jgi:branched-chain amino acid aminotransferase
MVGTTERWGAAVAVSAFRNGEFVPLDEVTVSVQSHAFQYGTSVFEGIRGYWDAAASELLLFRPDRHYTRLHRSAGFYGMTLPYSVDDLSRITAELLVRDGVREDAYIRPVVFKDTNAIGVWRRDLTDSFVVFHVPMGRYLADEAIRCCVSTWRRPDGNAAPVRAKIGGLYATMALSRYEAMLQGFDEAITLTADGHVAEGTGENIFLVQDGRLVTPSAGEDLLAGITRECIIELAESEFGLDVVERSVNRSELYVSDEIFLVGTAAEVTPVAEVDRRVVGDGQTGPVTAALRDIYSQVVHGRVAKYRHWSYPVYAQVPDGARP